MSIVAPEAVRQQAISELSSFRMDLYAAMPRRADALFEVSDALLCADGPVRALVELALAPEHRRSHGSLYAALNRGDLDAGRLRAAIATASLPRGPGGRIVLAVDVSAWLRPDANTSDARPFCHTYGRREKTHEMVPGWPYSFVAALESGSTSAVTASTPPVATAPPASAPGTACTPACGDALPGATIRANSPSPRGH